MREEPTKTFKKYGDIPFEFQSYIETLCFLCDHITYEVLKPYPANSDEYRAYQQSREYRGLKHLSYYLRDCLLYPERLNYCGETVEHCHKKFIEYIKKANVKSETIKILFDRYEQFLLEAKDAGRRRSELRASVRAKLNEIGVEKLPSSPE